MSDFKSAVKLAMVTAFVVIVLLVVGVLFGVISFVVCGVFVTSVASGSDVTVLSSDLSVLGASSLLSSTPVVISFSLLLSD